MDANVIVTSAITSGIVGAGATAVVNYFIQRKLAKQKHGMDTDLVQVQTRAEMDRAKHEKKLSTYYARREETLAPALDALDKISFIAGRTRSSTDATSLRSNCIELLHAVDHLRSVFSGLTLSMHTDFVQALDAVATHASEIGGKEDQTEIGALHDWLSEVRSCARVVAHDSLYPFSRVGVRNETSVPMSLKALLEAVSKPIAPKSGGGAG